MIAYFDASVILRVVLRERDRLTEWDRIESGVASALTEVECLRTLDRLVKAGAMSDVELAERRTAVYRLLEACDVVDVGRPILRRAAEPFPTALGILGAIHLATALAWRERNPLVVATHDTALKTAARAMGFDVIGA